MMPLSKTEAEIINYLYKHGREYRYAAEIARELGIKRRTIYDSLDSLEQKGIVQKQLRGRMKFYALDDKWMSVAEAAKTLIAETGEAITPSDQIKVLESLLKQIDSISPMSPTIGFELTGAKEILKKALQKARKSKVE